MKMLRGNVMMRSWVLVCASVVVLAGCGSAGPPVAATPSPTAPPPVYTLEQLQAALPGVDDVPTGVKLGGTCPGGEGCQDGVTSVVIEMVAPIEAAAADAETIENKSDIGDDVYFRAESFADETAATAEVDKTRADDQKYVGDFDLAPKEIENGFVPGERGAGTSDDLTIEAWKGIEATRTSTWLAPEGFDLFNSNGEIEITKLTLALGSNVFSVRVTVKVDYREVGTSGVIARQLAEDYISTLAS